MISLGSVETTPQAKENVITIGRARDTVHFGRRTYFVGNKELVKDYNKRTSVSELESMNIT